MNLLRLVLALIIAFGSGMLVRKLRLPAILGWLIAGMVVGPFAVSIISQPMMDAQWFQMLMSFFEIGVGCLLGTELILKNLKKFGKQILVTTLFQSLGTFLFVTLVFGSVFYFMNITFYVAVLIGGIALATAPAPALSIIQEYDTKGPVSSTLIPMAVLDDVVAIIVFFSLTSIITAMNTDQSTSLLFTLIMMIGLPLLVGSMVGYVTAVFLKKELNSKGILLTVLSGALVSTVIGLALNHFVFGTPMLNFMLIGMAYSTVFSNLVTPERLEEILVSINGMISFFLMSVIVSLGAELDYRLIIGAGLFTFIYIASRGIGKYFGANLGARMTQMPKTVQKYLGLTLLPHSGVSLVFTGIAATTLAPFDPASALVIQGTIAAAAIINEIIAVLLAKKAFEWAGEITETEYELAEEITDK